MRPMNIDDECPIPRSSVESYEVADETILYDRDRRVAFSLNTHARAIWELCDGARSVQQITSVLAEWLDRYEPDLHEDIRNTIHRFRELGIVSFRDL